METEIRSVGAYGGHGNVGKLQMGTVENSETGFG